jgi:hypothetical protein
MKMTQVSDSCYAVLNEKNRVCDPNSGLVNRGGTGCDHDDFIDPGAEIQITFERLGTLRCRFGEPTGKLSPSRWPVRDGLRKYHE